MCAHLAQWLLNHDVLSVYSHTRINDPTKVVCLAVCLGRRSEEVLGFCSIERTSEFKWIVFVRKHSFSWLFFFSFSYPNFRFFDKYAFWYTSFWLAAEIIIVRIINKSFFLLIYILTLKYNMKFNNLQLY